MLTNLIATVAILLVVGAASFYIIRAKKRGKKCIGCPDSCSGNCSSCSQHCNEKK
jgi:hypothetical protein